MQGPFPGTYALVLESRSEVELQVGRLGVLRLQKGFYIYAGSAFGPGGVKGRLAHHRKVARRPHWHVDYLRAVTRLAEIWYTYDAARREHQWAAALAELAGATMPCPGFGSSDCACPTHLFFCTERPAKRSFRRLLRRRAEDCGQIRAELVVGP